MNLLKSQSISFRFIISSFTLIFVRLTPTNHFVQFHRKKQIMQHKKILHTQFLVFFSESTYHCVDVSSFSFAPSLIFCFFCFIFLVGTVYLAISLALALSILIVFSC